MYMYQVQNRICHMLQPLYCIQGQMQYVSWYLYAVQFMDSEHYVATDFQLCRITDSTICGTASCVWHNLAFKKFLTYFIV